MSARSTAGPTDLVRRFIDACAEHSRCASMPMYGPSHYSPAPLHASFIDEARSLPPEQRTQLTILLFEASADVARGVQESGERRIFAMHNYIFLAPHAQGIAKLAGLMLTDGVPLSKGDVAKLLHEAAALEIIRPASMPHIIALLRHIEQRWTELGGHAEIRDGLAALARNARRLADTEQQKLGYRIETMLSPTPVIPLIPGEAWSDAAIADLDRMDQAQRTAWIDLLLHCRSATSGKPSRRWMTIAQAAVEAIDAERIEEHLLRWLPLVDRPRTAPGPRADYRAEGDAANHLILDHHGDILRGLCWVAGSRTSDALARALGALAVSCYRKLPGIGPRAVKVGNAAVHALGQMPGVASLGQLAMLRVKVKFGTAQALLGKALDAAAQREGLPRDEIEEMAVPSYGLSDVGVCRETLGEHTAVLGIESTTTSLVWIDSKGRTVRSVPAAVKRDHGDELKEMKASAKDIQKMLPAQRDRIDGMFLDRRSWALQTWRERYLDHPLVGTIARRLIWLFDDGRSVTAAAWLAGDADGPPHGEGRLVRADGAPFAPNEDATTVSLWHPIDPAGEPGTTEARDDVLAWRAFYEQRRIRQPFKQAHREIYLLTDAERSTAVYSNRFAAHVLRQHQFNALCGQRGWKNRLRLMVDAEYPPAHRVLPAWELRAEFWVEGVGDDWAPEWVLDSGAYRFLATDQVRFYRAQAAETRIHAYGGEYVTRGPDVDLNHPVPIDQIPPIVLSEVHRDVDLFVGVASVGNNPEWSDGGPDGTFREYWSAYSFGALSGTAQTRHEILQRLVPRLSIASACTVTDRFLVVLGRRRTYKIHLGSGNIMMEPNDQYLCIVPTQRMESGPNGQNIFLPFEGDRMLAIILSKAFMLAEDDRITDATIVSQIEASRR